MPKTDASQQPLDERNSNRIDAKIAQAFHDMKEYFTAERTKELATLATKEEVAATRL